MTEHFRIVRIKNIHMRRAVVIGALPFAIAFLLCAGVVDALYFSLRAIRFEVRAVSDECKQAIENILRHSAELMKAKPSP